MMTLKRSLTVLALTAGISGLVYADDLQTISQNINSTPALVSQGKTLFQANCASCHGNEGKGDGPAAAAFNPKPRNFTAEDFKQGSSPADTFYTITHGMGSMPSFTSLSEADRLATVHYVLSLSPKKTSSSASSLAKIGLDPTGKPLAGFSGGAKKELPVSFIIQRMAKDGDVKSLKAVDLIAEQEAQTGKTKKDSASTAVAAGPADAARGQVVYQTCQACHGKNAEGDAVVQAPQLAGQPAYYLVAQLKNFQSGIRGAHPDDVYGLKMRPLSRTLRDEQAVVDVAAYISSLPVTKPAMTMHGDPQKGQAAFGTCIACHGPDAKGVQAMKAPSLLGLQDWYMATQITHFKKGIRGADPRDTNGATMRGMAAVVADDQAVADIVSYIQTLK